MGQWFIGKIPLDKDINKRVTSFKNQHSIIPPFHYSMYEAEAQASKKAFILNKMYKFRSVYRLFIIIIGIKKQTLNYF